jgi:hypothetical protein
MIKKKKRKKKKQELAAKNCDSHKERISY